MLLPPRRHFEAERQVALHELERPLREKRSTDGYRALLELSARRAAKEAGDDYTPPSWAKAVDKAGEIIAAAIIVIGGVYAAGFASYLG